MKKKHRYFIISFLLFFVLAVLGIKMLIDPYMDKEILSIFKEFIFIAIGYIVGQKTN